MSIEQKIHELRVAWMDLKPMNKPTKMKEPIKPSPRAAICPPMINIGQELNEIGNEIGVDGLELSTIIKQLAETKDKTALDMLKAFVMYCKLGFAGDAIIEVQETVRKFNEYNEERYEKAMEQYQIHTDSYQKRLAAYDEWVQKNNDGQSKIGDVIAKIKEIVDEFDRDKPDINQYAFLYYLRRSGLKKGIPKENRNWYVLFDWMKRTNLEDYISQAYHRRPEALMQVHLPMKCQIEPNWDTDPY